eukprot:TRINITY_DN360_c0_g1_i2.p2 TRINITY_DN360_c0_g1~~TRINITY_DN360_c0_g1_i2.p2  ORF type:complete len:120 (+),score=16.48 TRINITY_DN360_c0_g1_i2:1277-1636(+)
MFFGKISEQSKMNQVFFLYEQKLRKFSKCLQKELEEETNFHDSEGPQRDEEQEDDTDNYQTKLKKMRQRVFLLALGAEFSTKVLWFQQQILLEKMEDFNQLQGSDKDIQLQLRRLKKMR